MNSLYNIWNFWVNTYLLNFDRTEVINDGNIAVILVSHIFVATNTPSALLAITVVGVLSHQSWLMYLLVPGISVIWLSFIDIDRGQPRTPLSLPITVLIHLLLLVSVGIILWIPFLSCGSKFSMGWINSSIIWIRKNEHDPAVTVNWCKGDNPNILVNSGTVSCLKPIPVPIKWVGNDIQASMCSIGSNCLWLICCVKPDLREGLIL